MVDKYITNDSLSNWKVLKGNYGNQYVKFSQEAPNLKGGMHASDLGIRVYISDGNKCG